MAAAAAACQRHHCGRLGVLPWYAAACSCLRLILQSTWFTRAPWTWIKLPTIPSSPNHRMSTHASSAVDGGRSAAAVPAVQRPDQDGRGHSVDIRRRRAHRGSSELCCAQVFEEKHRRPRLCACTMHARTRVRACAMCAYAHCSISLSLSLSLSRARARTHTHTRTHAHTRAHTQCHKRPFLVALSPSCTLRVRSCCARKCRETSSAGWRQCCGWQQRRAILFAFASRTSLSARQVAGRRLQLLHQPWSYS